MPRRVIDNLSDEQLNTAPSCVMSTTSAEASDAVQMRPEPTYEITGEMFDAYNNIPEDNITRNNEPKVSNRWFRKPLGEYDINNKLVGYKWDYGDVVVLDFSTDGYALDDATGQYQTVDTYFAGKSLELIIFDYKHNVMLKKVTNASMSCKFIISQEESETLVRGAYTAQLSLIETDGSKQILFSECDGKLFVR